MKFEVGDIVEAFGVRGKITEITEDHLYPIEVLFDNNEGEAFTSDGKQHVWHKAPSLHLIERPKKKNKRVFKEWISSEGILKNVLITENRRNIYGQTNYSEDEFLMWTGREFEIEVDW